MVAAAIGYNIVEAAVAITTGALASSSALVGFGVGSLIEVSSAAALAWQFSARDASARAARERRALRVTAVSFLALAAFVAIQAGGALLGADAARPSPAGIGLAAASLFVMPVLSASQRRAAHRLGSVSAAADSRQTLLCTYLSGVLLAGLLVNALFRWAWADPAAGLVIAAVAVRESVSAWRGQSCCALPSSAPCTC